MAGVLMPVASLPSDDGVGSFGKEAYRLVDYLAKTGFKLWQVLPLNPLGFGNSPYQAFSSFAGDELYIDLDLLVEEGYLSSKKRKKVKNRGRINYEAAREHKLPYLREAFKEFEKQNKERKAFDEFCAQQWVYEYAVFITLKNNNGDRSWNKWPKKQRDWILDREFDVLPFNEDIRFHIFLQYTFLKQWRALKKYANSKGILMVGDIPFYVGLDSLDVWKHRENFLLDKDGRPTFIAGVPPDHFSKTGQRWGNPIYNWKHLEENGFEFWVERLRYNANLYDILRIDHFRAFDTYWKVPASCKTAMKGEWVEAPGYALFDKVFEEMPNLWVIAEDLGDLRPEVLELRDAYGLPGMRIAEFTLSKPKQAKNQVIYTGTHDNDPVVGWYKSLKAKERKEVDEILKKEGSKDKNISYRMMHYVFNNEADYAIVPVMDILELGTSARINLPSTVGSPNWEWQMKNFDALEATSTNIKRMLRNAKRI